jgi:hypothetical protein
MIQPQLSSCDPDAHLGLVIHKACPKCKVPVFTSAQQATPVDQLSTASLQQSVASENVCRLGSNVPAQRGRLAIARLWRSVV